MSTYMTNLYVLSDGEKYYVGKADNVEKRYTRHIREAFKDNLNYWTHKNKWIRSYGSPEEARKHIKIIRIKEVPYDEWEVRERAQIATYRDIYGRENVMNGTDGGDGGQTVSPEEHWNAKLDWSVVRYIRDSDKMAEDLAKEFGVNRGIIFRIWNNTSWVDPEYIPKDRRSKYSPYHPYPGPKEPLVGEQNGNSKLTWHEIFMFRFHYKPYGKGKSSKKYAAERLGVSDTFLSTIYHNHVWVDPNWDPERRVYIGPPHGWEEDWGSWEH